MTTNIEKMIKDIDTELIRVKQFVNEGGYNNMTAINSCVRKYRTELKYLRYQLTEDRHHGLKDYKDT